MQMKILDTLTFNCLSYHSVLNLATIVELEGDKPGSTHLKLSRASKSFKYVGVTFE